MVTRVLLEMCGPTQVSSRTTDQELPDRVMRHPALTHCSSHTQKKPGDIHTLAGCQGGSQGTLKAWEKSDPRLYTTSERAVQAGSRETIFSWPKDSGLKSLRYADDLLIQLQHDKRATYLSVTYKEDTLIQRTAAEGIFGMDKHEHLPGKQGIFISRLDVLFLYGKILHDEHI